MALDAMDGATMQLRRVREETEPGAVTYHCHCGAQAAFFLIEIEPWAVIVQQTQASRTSIGKLDVYMFDSAFDAERWAMRQTMPTNVVPLKGV
jgi:hypothetical protein